MAGTAQVRENQPGQPRQQYGQGQGQGEYNQGQYGPGDRLNSARNRIQNYESFARTLLQSILEQATRASTSQTQQSPTHPQGQTQPQQQTNSGTTSSSSSGSSAGTWNNPNSQTVTIQATVSENQQMDCVQVCANVGGVTVCICV